MSPKTEELVYSYSRLAAEAGDIEYQISRLRFDQKQRLRSMQQIQKQIKKAQGDKPEGLTSPIAQEMQDAEAANEQA